MFRITICLLSSIIFYTSCKSNVEKQQNIFLETNESLQQSASVINVASQDALEALKNKTQEPGSKFKAEQWLPVAQQIQQLTSETVSYIEQLKIGLQKQAGLGMQAASTDIQPSESAVRDLFVRDKKAEELFLRLQGYREAVLKLNERIHQEFSSHTTIVIKEIASSPQGQKKFEQAYFGSDNVYQALSVLNSLKNNVCAAGYKYIVFCNSQVGSVDGNSMFNSFEAIVGQNAQLLLAGYDLEITAGLGSFSKINLPKITIGGKVPALNERGFVVYKMKTSKRPGLYSVPVKIEFIDQDGQKQERTFNVEYTTVESK